MNKFILVILACCGIACSSPVKREIKYRIERKWTTKLVNGKLVKDYLVKHFETQYWHSGTIKTCINKLTGDIYNNDSLIIKTDGNNTFYIKLDNTIAQVSVQKNDTIYHYNGDNLKEYYAYETVDHRHVYIHGCADIKEETCNLYMENINIKKNTYGDIIKLESEEYAFPWNNKFNDLEKQAYRLQNTRHYISEREITYY